jgi:hypothetical protein
VDAFKALVEAGTLPGTVTDGGDVVLDQLSRQQLELLTSEGHAELWSWTEPGVLTRAERN